MEIKIATVGLAHPFEVGYAEAPALLDQTAEQLSAIGACCINTGVIMHDLASVQDAVVALKNADADVLLICVATWSEDHHLLDLLGYVDKPVILRATRDHCVVCTRSVRCLPISARTTSSCSASPMTPLAPRR